MNKEAIERCAREIPTNWCDPLLTGPNAVIGRPPYDCNDIEHLLQAIKERVQHCATAAPDPKTANEAWRDGNTFTMQINASGVFTLA